MTTLTVPITKRQAYWERSVWVPETMVRKVTVDKAIELSRMIIWRTAASIGTTVMATSGSCVSTWRAGPCSWRSARVIRRASTSTMRRGTSSRRRKSTPERLAEWGIQRRISSEIRRLCRVRERIATPAIWLRARE